MRVTNSPIINTSTSESLIDSSGVTSFDFHAFIDVRNQVLHRNYPRESLVSILEDYNKKIGNDVIALENIKKLVLPSNDCVVTGQQLGLMGGPLYAILKGISCLLIARQTGAVPIYWLATEDHDVAEIDHTYLIDSNGNFKRFALTLPRDGTPVETLRLSQKNLDEISAFWSFLEVPSPLFAAVGELYSLSMVKLLVSLFAGTGMVFLEPKLLRPLAIPFFLKEITECQTIQQLLKDTTDKIEKTGEPTVLKVGEPTNLFFINKNDKRFKLRFNGEFFSAGTENFTLDELLSKVRQEPQSFSCNAAARPVLQNTLLPVIAYVGGPTEIEYHKQLKDYHLFHGVSMPWVIPRLSATFILSDAEKALQSSHLQPWDEIPLHLEQAQGKELHLLRNLFHPHNKPQERLLNWWGFQAKTQENLLAECLEQLSWNSPSPYYIYL